MSLSDNDGCVTILVYGGLLSVVFAIAGTIGLWRASIQADVYRRQGVEMSTWECFWGAKPAERVIQMKDSK